MFLQLPPKKDQKEDVQNYWDSCPCEIQYAPSLEWGSLELYDTLEKKRYDEQAAFLHSFIQFTRQHGKRVLEIGVGVGTDFTQTARAGADAVGIDLTRTAAELVKKRMRIYGLEANVLVSDGENLPFRQNCFDFIYSIGVIHHSPSPPSIINEIHRVLKPGGRIKLAMYSLYSGATFRYYFKYALFKGKPLMSFSKVLAENIESKGTKAYKKSQMESMLSGFSDINMVNVLLDGERDTFRRMFHSQLLAKLLPNKISTFWFVSGKKPDR